MIPNIRLKRVRVHEHIASLNPNTSRTIIIKLEKFATEGAGADHVLDMASGEPRRVLASQERIADGCGY